jgi:hypothetical protein
MKHLKLYKIFESVESISDDLKDILTDLKDVSGDWYSFVEGDDMSKFIEVYISFGDEDPQELERDEDDEGPVYKDENISDDVILTITTVMNYMKNINWNGSIFIVTEFGNDPDYDMRERVTLEELKNCFISENESIRLTFRKD